MGRSRPYYTPLLYKSVKTQELGSQEKSAFMRESVGNGLAWYQGMPSQFVEKVSARIRACLQACHKSLKMRPALAAEAAVNRREMTFSATSSGIPQFADEFGFSGCLMPAENAAHTSDSMS